MARREPPNRLRRLRIAAGVGVSLALFVYLLRSVDLPEAHASVLRANPRAWADFEARPASYRKAVMWWIVSAKQEATRQRRLQVLIECGARGETVPPFARP